ncbi:MAG: alpha/beta hydrolase [Pseudomonadota bacterium]
MNYLTSNDVEIAYLDEGEGPDVLLGHCSAASHKEWAPLIEILAKDWRVLAPDFIGYGQSAPWPAEKPFSIEADVDVLLAVAEKAQGRLHLVGHSYGAALALEAARILKDKVKSLTLVEPVSFHLLRLEDLPEWQDIEKLSLAVLDPVAKGEDKKAAAAFMSYWLGKWRWWIAPERFKSAIAATIPKVALEFSIAIDAKGSTLDYAKIDAPTLLIMGSKTPPPTRAVSELLSKTLPNVTLTTLKGAGHMSPFTHPEKINQLILDHLSAHR